MSVGLVPWLSLQGPPGLAGCLAQVLIGGSRGSVTSGQPLLFQPWKWYPFTSCHLSWLYTIPLALLQIGVFLESSPISPLESAMCFLLEPELVAKKWH